MMKGNSFTTINSLVFNIDLHSLGQFINVYLELHFVRIS